MPRIDPNQLLTCLNPLLAMNGGIKSSSEVIRLANLMEKYSKKLVSKCIYIQILKCTETELLGQFMAAGGWNLVHNWLRDGSESLNWAFVQEILEMLLLCPVDGNRLKSNHTPKIVKNLSVSCPHNAVRILSSKLVQQWLRIAHQEKQLLSSQTNGLNGSAATNGVMEDTLESKLSQEMAESIKEELKDEEVFLKSPENVKYKVSNKESSGKLLLSLKRSTSPTIDENDTSRPKIANGASEEIKSPSIESKSLKESKTKENSEKDKEKDKKSSSHKSSSSRSSSSSKSSHKDKERSSSSKSHHKSSSSSSSSKSSNKSSSSSRDKDRDRKKESERDKNKEKEKSQAEKDKETLNFLMPQSSAKLQRIPKRQHSENEKTSDGTEASANKIPKTSESAEKKKPSISIEVRKGDKPKTVKMVNSQFRDHGLAEEPPKPPSRKDLKKPPTNSTAPPVISNSTSKTPIVASPSPSSPPPSKKISLDTDNIQERVGGVKLIKPKPMLVESISFMDALSASAVTKKDSKKRKRLPSGSSSKKDEPESPKIEAKPLKFYKDTLEENEEETSVNGEKSPTKQVEREPSPNLSKERNESVKSPVPSETTPEKSPEQEVDETEEKRPPGIGCGPDGPPCAIVGPNATRRKKRPIRWRPDEELTEIRYFELDETERTNVTKTSFMEQKQMEHDKERSIFLLGRKPQTEDNMVEQVNWRPLIQIDNVPSYNYGSLSREITVQAEREQNVLQDIYFRPSLKDTPGEPDHENYEHIEPQIIPFEDITGNADSVTSFRDIQWPVPKGDLPATFSSNAFANVFSNIGMPATIGIPPNIGINNPLANFNPLNMPAREPVVNQWIVPPTPFMQPPPIIISQQQQNQPGFGGRANMNNFRGVNNNHRDNGNWVRGNARRGVCHQFQRNGFCRNKNCQYIHER